MKHKRLRLGFILSIAAIMLLAGAMVVAIVINANNPKNLVSASIAVPAIARQPREVRSVLTNSDGDLIITYSDGTTQNAGHVSGTNGSGLAPTSLQIYAALQEYCASGTCDAKAPTEGQILSALTSYCASGICKGADATPVSAQQIADAVANYCAGAACTGATGTPGPVGPNGIAGPTTFIACVQRTATDFFVSWKYTTEPDTAYRDIYKLAITDACTNPVDLTPKPVTP